MRLGPSMCQQCTTTWMVPYANTVSIGHSMSTCDALATTGKKALPNFSSPMADESGANTSPSRLSNWLVECIKFAYEKHDLPVPHGVKGHQTQKMAVTYADLAGADPQTICETTTWQSFNTFAKFYRLDSIANSDAEFGRRVLTLAGSSTPALHWGGYRIPQTQDFRR